MMDNGTHCFGFMGYPGAGKSYGASLVAKQLDVDAVAIGDVVRENATNALGPDADSDAIGNWVTEQLDQDETAINSWVIDRIRNSNMDSEFAIIDGIRTVSDVDVFSEEFGQFTLVYVHASPETRLERLQDRGRDGEGDFTMDDLKRRDAREDDWGVGSLIEDNHYDVMVDNDGDESFSTRLSEVIDSRI